LKNLNRFPIRPSFRHYFCPFVLPSLFLSVRPSVTIFVRPSFRHYFCPSVLPSLFLSVRSSVTIFVRPSFRHYFCPSVTIFVRPSLFLSVRPSAIFLSVVLPTVCLPSLTSFVRSSFSKQIVRWSAVLPSVYLVCLSVHSFFRPLFPCIAGCPSLYLLSFRYSISINKLSSRPNSGSSAHTTYLSILSFFFQSSLPSI
jgi:hypothetical protein